MQTGGMVLNKLERKLYRFRAGIYMHLPRRSGRLKLQLALILLCVLLFSRKVFGDGKDDKTETAGGSPAQTEQREEEKNGEFRVQYVSGSRMVLEKDVVIVLPGQEETEEKEDAEAGEEEPQRETVPVAGTVYQSTFRPENYPGLSDIVGTKYLMENLLQLEYLKENFYIVNSTTKMTEKEFDTEYFLKTDLSIERKEEPQILIYHTHASEGFIDSRVGATEDTVVGMGELLAEILREKYGYNVIHDTTVFDRKDGKDNRSNAYSEALAYMEKFLDENPSIEVVIDLHRDAGTKRVVTLQGEQVAKVMLFNGLSRNKEKELSYLPNKYLKDNLAFSFQMKLIGDEMYPGLMNRIFLKDYRYNMHLRERYLLVELGTQNNTVKEAQNAMEPLADVLAQVLRK